VEIFLSRPSVKDEPDNEGRTAFLWAAAYGANAVISCFIRLGVDLLQMDKTGATGKNIKININNQKASIYRIQNSVKGLISIQYAISML